MIGPLLRVAAASAAARTIRVAAAGATNRLMLTLGAGVGGAVAVLCFSRVALTLLERQMDPVGAWAILGCFYGVMGGVLYFAATRRRA